MSKPQVIDVSDIPNRWMTLLLTLNNSTVPLYQLMFPSAGKAEKVASRMSALIRRYPKWFDAVVCARGSCVFVLKTKHAKKVVIVDVDD